jgi:hypothetical protein
MMPMQRYFASKGFVDAVFRAPRDPPDGADALSFMPPKGVISPAGFRRDDALVDADDTVFERLGDAPDAADVATVEIRAPPCSACFIRSRSGIANSFKNKRPRSRGADLATIRCDYGVFTVA